jgi:hypothetical protein
MLLVISSVCFLVTPLASTSEVTNDYAAKVLAFLNQVAGFNSTRYTSTTTLATTKQPNINPKVKSFDPLILMLIFFRIDIDTSSPSIYPSEPVFSTSFIHP